MKQFETAYVTQTGKQFEVGTGKFSRVFVADEFGIQATSVCYQGRCETTKGGYIWGNEALIPTGTTGYFVGLQSKVQDDEGFTTQHLQVEAYYYYPAVGVSIMVEFWLYPNADGIRMQLWVKGKHGDATSAAMPPEIQKKGHNYIISNVSNAKQYSVALKSALATGEALLVSTDGEASQAVTYTENEKIDIPNHLYLGEKFTLNFAQCGQNSAEVSLYCGDELLVSYNEMDMPLAPTRTDDVVDFMPVETAGKKRFAFGYYTDTQNRNSYETPILKEGFVQEDCIPWASGLSIEDEQGGFILVKESHKCVNQSGVFTGVFCVEAQGVSNTGWTMQQDVEPETYRWCWADWMIGFTGGEFARQQALKVFDRLRFPVKKERDLYTVMCTWGNSDGMIQPGRAAATQEKVLYELDYVKESGIDMLLIDDGWQTDDVSTWLPPVKDGWIPSVGSYQYSWDQVVEKGKALGLRFGLWSVAQNITSDELVHNFNMLHMEQVKLDFANLSSYTLLNNLKQRMRDFMKRTDYQCEVSWDTTEVNMRYGYFWAREFGNVHFMNRKPKTPESVIYKPYTALKDFWQLAKYQNLNKWQLTIQNPTITDRSLSEAYRYTVDYCAATALMGIPEFMAITSTYTKEERATVKYLLDQYKAVREEIFDGCVFPILQEPNGARYTGFQSVVDDTASVVLLFRELDNKEDGTMVPLGDAYANKQIQVTDCLQGTTTAFVCNEKGEIPYVLADAGSYALLKICM